jgi:hypothetical protein
MGSLKIFSRFSQEAKLFVESFSSPTVDSSTTRFIATTALQQMHDPTAIDTFTARLLV